MTDQAGKRKTQNISCIEIQALRDVRTPSDFSACGNISSRTNILDTWVKCFDWRCIITTNFLLFWHLFR